MIQRGPIVSIIVPLYNQERYLEHCLHSICNQSYHNLEVIVVNDGSTDHSLSVAESWAEKDHRIKLLNKSNEGVTMARRDGLLQATGEYVAFVDSDDLLPPHSVEILVQHMVEFDVDLVIGAVVKKLGFIKRRHVDDIYTFPVHQKISQPELFDKYFVGFYQNDVFPVTMWGRLYRKAAIDKAIRETELFDKDVDRMGEDQLFNLKLFPYLRSMYRTDEIVYEYRFGGGTTRFNPYFPQLFVSSDKRLELLDRFHYTLGYQPLFEEYVACIYFYASQLIFDNRADKQGVVEFFKHEMEHREVAQRLMAFYNKQDSESEPLRLFLERDFEGMYQYASNEGNKMFGSIKFKTKKMLLQLIEHFC